MNVLSDIQFDRLHKAIEWSNKQLDYSRNKRISAIKQFIGFHCLENGSEERVPLPMIALAVLIYQRLLCAKAPRVLISTKQQQLKPTAANLELRMNQIPEEINLAETFQENVMEALFSMGIAKVGLHTVGKVLGHDYGDSFVDSLTIDDYFCDMAAKKTWQIDYEGNDYWLNYDDVMDYKWSEKSERDKLKPDAYTVIGPNGQEKAESLTSSDTPTLFKDKILLRDVWLPSEKQVITYQVKTKTRLHIVDWTEEHGPYYKLGYSKIPGNLLPFPPMSMWRDLHELANDLFRKLGRQAVAEKTIQGFPGGNDESVENFKKAKDGEGIRYAGSDPKILKAGGVNPQTMVFDMQCRDLFSYFAGNLDSLGGLGAITQTVGQDKMIGDAASAQLKDMADKTVTFIKDIFKQLMRYEWSDPVKRRILEKPIPGTDKKLPTVWDNEAKLGNFSQYDLNIDIYSLQDDSPQTKLQKLKMLVEGFIAPLGPMLQAAGAAPDAQKIVTDATRWMGMTSEGPYITFMEPDASQQGKQQPPTSTPTNTTHTSERIGRPGQSRQGASAMMQQALLGQNPGGENSANSQ